MIQDCILRKRFEICDYLLENGANIEQDRLVDRAFEKDFGENLPKFKGIFDKHRKWRRTREFIKLKEQNKLPVEVSSQLNQNILRDIMTDFF